MRSSTYTLLQIDRKCLVLQDCTTDKTIPHKLDPTFGVGAFSISSGSQVPITIYSICWPSPKIKYKVMLRTVTRRFLTRERPRIPFFSLPLHHLYSFKFKHTQRDTHDGRLHVGGWLLLCRLLASACSIEKFSICTYFFMSAEICRFLVKNYFMC